MQYPKVEFITNDLEEQAKYICFLATAIQRGIYQELGFLVLPYVFTQYHNSVYFPNLPYSPKFWQIISKCYYQFGGNYPNVCVKEVAGHLKKLNSRTDFQKNQVIITNWQKKEKDFFQWCQEFLNPQKSSSKIGRIEVLPTDFGTQGSFTPHKTNDKIIIKTSFRRDLPIAALAHTLLLAFYTIKNNKPHTQLGWYERKAAIDYLFKETSLEKIFPNYQLKKDLLDNNQTDKLVTESKNYLAKLGFPAKPTITLNQKGNLFFLEKTIDSLLTNQESKVLTKLVKSYPQVVSYDQLAEILWGKQADEKFSLYAIAKVIENLRRKLFGAGINQDLITTVRGQGYLLKD